MSCHHHHRSTTTTTTTTTDTFTFSPRAGDIRRKIANAPLLHAVNFFRLHVVAHETRGTFGSEKDFENEDDKFLLDDEKWRKLQLYVKASQRLPTTQQNLEVQFGDNVSEALSETVVTFLLSVYTTLAGNCDTFQKDYYKVVSLANDVVSYARDTETYYPRIDKLFNVLLDPSNPAAADQAAIQLRAIFSALSDRTEARASKVEATFHVIDDFRLATSKDKSQVATVSTSVAGQDSNVEDTIKDILANMKKKRETLDKFTKEYDEAVRKGVMTAAYIWIPIVGWIAGPIVSAQASAEARAAWNEVQRLNKELKELDKDLRHAQRLKETVSQFNEQVDDIAVKIKDALDTLAIMSAAWLRMSDDFKEIAQSLVNWQEHTDILAQLDFEAQQKTWAQIRKLANDYVARAFVETTDAARIEMNFSVYRDQ